MHAVLLAVESRRVCAPCGRARNNQCREQDPAGFRMFEEVEPMGRGRAKAKQVKVARQLKYNSGGTDLDRLRTELGVGRGDEDEADPGHADLVDRYRDVAGADGEDPGADE
jgi:hypothetical protein